MAERRVEINLSIKGADEAAREVNKLREQVERTDTAAGRARRGVERLTGGGQGGQGSRGAASAGGGGGGIDPLNWAPGDDGGGNRARTMSEMAAERAARRTLNKGVNDEADEMMGVQNVGWRRNPATQNYIRTQRELDRDEARYNRETVGSGTGSRREADRLRSQTQNQLERDRRAFERSDPQSVANARMAKESLDAEVDELMGKTPSAYARFRKSLAGSGLSRTVMPLFLTHVAGQAVEGLGRGLEEAVSGGMSSGETVNLMARRMMEALPIIGGFVRGIESINRVLGNLSAVEGANRAMMDFQTRTLAVNQTRVRSGITRDLGNAQARLIEGAGMARGRAATDLLVGGRLGRETEAALLQSQAAAVTAEGAHFGERADQLGADAEMIEGVPGKPGPLARAALRHDQLLHARRVAGDAGIPLGAGFDAAIEQARGEAEQFAQQATGARGNQLAALEAQKTMREKRLQAEEARNQQLFHNAQAAVGEHLGIYQRAGRQTAAGNQADYDVLQQIERGGLQSVTPEELRQAEAVAPGFMRRTEQLAGANDPYARLIAQKYGDEEMADPAGKLKEIINRENGEALKKYATAFGETYEKFVGDIIKINDKIAKTKTQEAQDKSEQEIRQQPKP